MLYEPKQERLCILTIKSLDGLRGLAVLLVLLSHMSLVGINLLPGLDFSGMGKSGVYLFFVLSAFLLTWQALEADNILSPSYWAGYAVRRVCRIYPLYTMAVLFSFGLTNYAAGYAPVIDAPINIVRHLTLREGEGIYWAIPVEFKYYLLLPFVTLIIAGCSRVHFILPFVVTCLAVFASYRIWPPADTVANSIGLGPYLAMFFLGSLSAVLCSGSGKINVLLQYPRILEITGWLSIAVALLTIPALTRALFDPEIENNTFHREFIFYGVIWSIAVVSAFHGRMLFQKFFAFPACRFVGRVSFSVYLWHIIILNLVNKQIDIHHSLQFVLTVGLTFLISYASYRFLERPFISWGHRASDKWMV